MTKFDMDTLNIPIYPSKSGLAHITVFSNIAIHSKTNPQLGGIWRASHALPDILPQRGELISATRRTDYTYIILIFEPGVFTVSV